MKAMTRSCIWIIFYLEGQEYSLPSPLCVLYLRVASLCRAVSGQQGGPGLAGKMSSSVFQVEGPRMKGVPGDPQGCIYQERLVPFPHQQVKQISPLIGVSSCSKFV